MVELGCLAIFVSGEGTNFAVLREAVREGEIPARIGLVVADRPCRALERAEAWGYPRLLLDRRFVRPPERERELLKRLEEGGVTHLVLAGYLTKLGAEVVASFEGRALNLHPSLLPSFPGLDAIGQALKAGVKVTGVTVHLVDEGLDTGPIIWQEPLAVRQGETHESLRERIRPLEHRAVVVATKWMVEGRLERRGRHVTVKEEIPS